MPDRPPAHHGSGSTVGGGLNCAVDTEVSKQSNVGRDETMVGLSKVVVGHSGARTRGQREVTDTFVEKHGGSAACHSVAFDVKPTVPITVNASHCPRERQFCSTRDPCSIAKDVTVSDDDDNVVLSSDVLRSKVVDDDAFSETHSNVSKEKGFATVSVFDKPINKTRFSRCELPRRKNILVEPRIKHAGTFVQTVLRHPHKNKPYDFLPSAVSTSGDLSAIADIGFAKKTTRKQSERCEYPDMFHTLRHLSVKTPSRYELWLDEIGD